jgi:hypothetical protein
MKVQVTSAREGGTRETKGMRSRKKRRCFMVLRIKVDPDGKMGRRGTPINAARKLLMGRVLNPPLQLFSGSGTAFFCVHPRFSAFSGK